MAHTARPVSAASKAQTKNFHQRKGATTRPGPSPASRTSLVANRKPPAKATFLCLESSKRLVQAISRKPLNLKDILFVNGFCRFPRNRAPTGLRAVELV